MISSPTLHRLDLNINKEDTDIGVDAASLGTAALCSSNGTDADAHAREGSGGGDDEDAQEASVVLEFANFADRVLVEQLLARVLVGEEELTTEDGVPVRAVVCSAATTEGIAMAVADDDDAVGEEIVLDDDKSSDGGANGGGGGVVVVEPDTGTETNGGSGRASGPTVRSHWVASSSFIGGIIAAVVLGLLAFVLLVGLRRRRRMGIMRVKHAEANVVRTAAGGGVPSAH